MKAVIFGNNYKKENLILLQPLFDMMEQRGVEVYVEREFYAFIAQHIGRQPKVAGLIAGEGFDADLAISMGGDGTFLKTAAHIGKKNIPIIGINTGRLGFLADIASTDIKEPFERILNGEYVVEERSVLELDCGGKKRFGGLPYALNEVAVLKQDSSSMITIHTFLNDQHLVDYQADGLIVATPTGSTAYSMSVGGPLLMPSAHDFVLTPVAPHSLTIRPLVITDDSEIRLHVTSRTHSFLASVDGRSELFDLSAELRIKKADFTIKVVKQHENAFFSTLKNKLMWGADKRNKSLLE
ncbi:MAG: NAD kinase [Paludibacteraceae bacterium]|nr:NAD kinase [Paludibacteraceae bacterium]